jgi:glycosyltransferase involved in cell wall biosynthesis
MKVLFDYPALSQTYGGVSRYICELIKELKDDIEIDMSILFTDNIYLEELQFLKIKKLISKRNFKGKGKMENLINSVYANYKVMKNDYDIFHATYSDSYFLKRVKKPLVVTIHDMINEKLSEYHVSHANHILSKKNLIYNSSHIIAISENTKKDILEIYRVGEDKISVIHHGATIYNGQISKNEFGRYILYVGRRTRYKNFQFFVESITPILTKDKDLKLICVGPSFTQEEHEFISKLKISDRIIAIGVDDNQLNTLYSHALVFVFPSLFEGFGIPILEAFSNKCPVCLSDASCFPEIAGPAALYFDPMDKQSILENVERLITDRVLASKLTELGLERLPLFSWTKAAQQTLSVYKSVI